MNKDTLKLAGGSLLLGLFLLVFVFGPLPVAEGLYRVGLWPRLTPEEAYRQLTKGYHWNLMGCSEGVNGWDYVCEFRPDPERKFYDKIAGMGGVFGVEYSVELPPGPVPDRAAFEAKSREQFERAQRGER